MKDRMIVSLALSSLFLAGGIVAAAQDAAAPPPPPNVLVIEREYLKPGRSGSMHVKTEGAFIKAQQDANWKTHYIAMDSMSGPSRALFMFAYDSFDAYGKDQEAQNANATLSAAIDQAAIADGELLERYETNVYLYHPEMSVHAAVDVPHQRYWEFTVFRIKPGHDKEWSDLVKMYVDGYQSIPDAHWAAFENRYGENNGGLWVVINPMRSLNEVDKGLANDKSFTAAMGDAKMQHAGELAAACIESTQTNLFVVNAKESYADANWVKAAPEIYGQQ